MIMTRPEDLRNTLKELAPTHLAVAYFGRDWQTYLTNLHILKEIVVSPTIGSFPGALSELLDMADKYGFAVYFKPVLHAKIFIGDGGCLIGSSNLSGNGFGGGLQEAAVYLNDKFSVGQAHGVFNTLKKGGITSRTDQRKMIAELWSKWNRARRNDALPTEAGDRSAGTICDWKPSHERVWLAWLMADCTPTLSKANIQEAIPEVGQESPRNYFVDYTNLVEGDAVREGDWLIMWYAKQDSTPDLRSAPYWLRVDKLVPHGVVGEDEDYTQLAVTLPSKTYVAPPFEIANDPVIQQLIKTLLGREEYKILRWGDGNETWQFKYVEDLNIRFLLDLQQAYRDEVNYG